MTHESLKCAVRRHTHKISNNQLFDKEEAETDKSEHQTSVLGIISTTTVNGGRPKVSTLKNRMNLQERMDEAKFHLTCLLLDYKKNVQCIKTGTFHILNNYVTNKYDIH